MSFSPNILFIERSSDSGPGGNHLITELQKNFNNLSFERIESDASLGELVKILAIKTWDFIVLEHDETSNHPQLILDFLADLEKPIPLILTSNKRKLPLVKILEKMKLGIPDIFLKINQSQQPISIYDIERFHTNAFFHDINNYLSIISLHCTLALKKLLPDNPISEVLKQVQDAGNKANDLVQQLINFDRKESRRFQATDINSIIQSFCQLLAPFLGNDVKLVINLQDNLSSVLLDQGQFEQIMLNLLINAKESMIQKKGGRIIIDTRDIVIEQCEPKSYVQFSVIDNGTGIEDEIKKHIFKPYFTTKKNKDGTGFGLSLVYDLVIKNSGAIKVESEKGVGSTFIIQFPSISSPKSSSE